MDDFRIKSLTSKTCQLQITNGLSYTSSIKAYLKYTVDDRSGWQVEMDEEEKALVADAAGAQPPLPPSSAAPALPPDDDGDEDMVVVTDYRRPVCSVYTALHTSYLLGVLSCFVHI